MTAAQKLRIAGLFMMAAGTIIAVMQAQSTDRLWYWSGWVVLIAGAFALAMGRSKN